MARVLHVRIIFSLLLAIFCSSHTIFDIDELSVQYGIEISNKPVILNSHPVDENVLQLSSKHGQLYSCFLPPLLPQVDEKEPSKGTNTENVVDILDKSFNGTCTTHKKGWWTYKLCHKKDITQYHVPEIGDVSGPTTLLGSFSSEDDWTKEEVRERKPSELFHSHQYANGSICDVTQKQRKATVQYFCDTKSKDEIIRIEEPATCEYIITVHSSKLCTHPLFSKKEKKKQINLVCSPALIEHEFNKYTEKLNRKKLAAEEMVLKAKKELDKEKEVTGELDSSNKKTVYSGDKDSTIDEDKVGEKLKETMTSFMKGFMKVLNMKADDIKVTTKVIKNSKEVEDIIEPDQDELDLDDSMEKNKENPIEQNEGHEVEKDFSTVFSKAVDNSEPSVDKGSRGALSSKTELAAENVKDIEAGTDKLKSSDNIDANGKLRKDSTIKAINDITASMIKQLEKDSANMQHKAAKEREAMHIEFDRVRKESVKELERAKSLLHVLKSVKESTKVKSSQDHVERQLKFVQDLVDSLEDQIKLIDEKRKTVDELEEDTNKRLFDINQKIINTKTAHSVAKSLEGVTKNINEGEGGLKKMSSFKEKGVEDDEKLLMSERADVIEKEEDEKDEDKLQEKGDYEDLPKSSQEKSEDVKNKPSQLVSTMLTALKKQVLKLNKDLEMDKLGKRGDTASKNEKAVIDDFSSENKKKEPAKSDVTTKTGLNALVDILKKEMMTINKKMKKEKEKVSADARSKDETEKEVIEESERDAKENMEVRIRTIDEKAFDNDFDDDNVHDEVKEATKKMEDTVRKQLKDAGLDFKDNIKIKIITTKDKFDQFSKGKDVKLLTDDDAADFKDLLLGFLGGGKEKVKEERRQRTLENNYNFVFDDDDDNIE